jgi:hypothetical protein
MSTERQAMTERISKAEQLVPSHPAVNEATASLLERQLANGTPVGQFNGVVGGIVVFEAGGAGTVR